MKGLFVRILFVVGVVALFLWMLLAMASAHAGTAFFKYEIDRGGLIKQCVYDYLGDDYVINVKSYAICPLTIRV